MFQNNGMLPCFPRPVGLLNNFMHYYSVTVGWLPEPLYKFFMTFLLLFYMLSQIRLTTTQELNELEDFRQEQKNHGRNSKILNLESQKEKLHLEAAHNHMLATKFERDYIAASKSRDCLEAVLNETLNNLTTANAIIQAQENTITNQAKTIGNMAQAYQYLQREVKASSSLNMSQQQLLFFMFCALAEQSKTIASLQSDVELLQNKEQTANACLTNSEKALACWKNGPLQNILLCAFCLGSTLASQGKRLQYKEVSALCSEITKSTGFKVHKKPRDLLWEMYRLWEKNKSSWNLTPL